MRKTARQIFTHFLIKNKMDWKTEKLIDVTIGKINDISEVADVINELKDTIVSHEETIDDLKDRVSELEKELEAANETISNIQSD